MQEPCARSRAWLPTWHRATFSRSRCPTFRALLHRRYPAGPTVTVSDTATAPRPGPSRYLAIFVGQNGATETPDQADARRESRSRRYAAQAGIWRVTSLPRIAHCCRFLHGGTDFAYVALNEQRQGSWLGLQTCGSVHACPHCAPKIRQARAVQIERLGTAHLEAGGGLEFATLTMSHHSGDPLALTLDTVQNGWRSVQQNRAVRRLFTRLGILGAVRATEITHGYNGWHPHLHVLLFTTRQLTADDRAELQAVLFTAWRSYVVKRGYFEPSEARGVLLREVTLSRGADGLAAYLTKVQDSYGRATTIAREMARGDLKKGRRAARSPFEIAEGAAAGVAADVALWHEYEAATKGRRVITVSRRLTALYGVEDQGDEDLAAADEAVAVAALDAAEYRLVVRYKARVALLDAAERGGSEAVYERLRAVVRRHDHEQRKALR